MIKLIGLLGMKGAGKDTAARFLIERLGFVRTSFATSLYDQAAAAYGVSVAFLENRETKEKPLPELALECCRDKDFVDIALQYLTLQTRKAMVPNSAPAALQGFFWFVGALWARLHIGAELRAPRSPRWVLQLWGTEYRRRSRFGYDSYWLDRVAELVKDNPESRFVITDVRFTNEADWVESAGGMLIRISRPALEAQEESARKAGTVTALHPSETELRSRKVAYTLINEEGIPDSLIKGLSEVFPALTQAA